MDSEVILLNLDSKQVISALDTIDSRLRAMRKQDIEVGMKVDNASLSGLSSALSRYQRQVNSISYKNVLGGLTNIQERMDAVGKRALRNIAATGAAVGYAMTRVAKTMFNAVSETESAMRSVLTLSSGMPGNVAQNQQFVSEWLRDYVQHSVTETNQLTKALGMLMSSGTGTVESNTDALRRLDDVVGATGGSMEGLSRAWSQIMSKGKLMAQERNQLIDSGAGGLLVYIKRTLEAQGVTMEFEKAQEEGYITMDVMTEALRMATDAGGTFNNGQILMARTLKGSVSNAIDSVKNRMLDLAGFNWTTGTYNVGSFGDVLVSNVLKLQEWLNNEDTQVMLQQWSLRIGDALQNLIDRLMNMDWASVGRTIMDNFGFIVDFFRSIDWGTLFNQLLTAGKAVIGFYQTFTPLLSRLMPVIAPLGIFIKTLGMIPGATQVAALGITGLGKAFAALSGGALVRRLQREGVDNRSINALLGTALTVPKVETKTMENIFERKLVESNILDKFGRPITYEVLENTGRTIEKKARTVRQSDVLANAMGSVTANTDEKSVNRLVATSSNIGAKLSAGANKAGAALNKGFVALNKMLGVFAKGAAVVGLSALALAGLGIAFRALHNSLSGLRPDDIVIDMLKIGAIALAMTGITAGIGAIAGISGGLVLSAQIIGAISLGLSLISIAALLGIAVMLKQLHNAVNKLPKKVTLAKDIGKIYELAASINSGAGSKHIPIISDVWGVITSVASIVSGLARGLANVVSLMNVAAVTSIAKGLATIHKVAKDLPKASTLSDDVTKILQLANEVNGISVNALNVRTAGIGRALGPLGPLIIGAIDGLYNFTASLANKGLESNISSIASMGESLAELSKSAVKLKSANIVKNVNHIISTLTEVLAEINTSQLYGSIARTNKNVVNQQLASQVGSGDLLGAMITSLRNMFNISNNDGFKELEKQVKNAETFISNFQKAGDTLNNLQQKMEDLNPNLIANNINNIISVMSEVLMDLKGTAGLSKALDGLEWSELDSNNNVTEKSKLILNTQVKQITELVGAFSEFSEQIQELTTRAEALNTLYSNGVVTTVFNAIANIMSTIANQVASGQATANAITASFEGITGKQDNTEKFLNAQVALINSFIENVIAFAEELEKLSKKVDLLNNLATTEIITNIFNRVNEILDKIRHQVQMGVQGNLHDNTGQAYRGIAGPEEDGKYLTEQIAAISGFVDQVGTFIEAVNKLSGLSDRLNNAMAQEAIPRIFEQVRLAMAQISSGVSGQNVRNVSGNLVNLNSMDTTAKRLADMFNGKTENGGLTAHIAAISGFIDQMGVFIDKVQELTNNTVPRLEAATAMIPNVFNAIRNVIRALTTGSSGLMTDNGAIRGASDSVSIMAAQIQVIIDTIASLAEEIKKLAPKFEQAGVDLGVAFIRGWESKLPKNSMRNAVDKAVAAISNAVAREKGVNLGNALRAGFITGTANLVSSVQNQLDSLRAPRLNAVMSVSTPNIRALGSSRGITLANGGQVPYYAKGGSILGDIERALSRGTDTKLIMATPGEFMQRKASVDFWGVELFKKMNNLDVRGTYNLMSQRMGLQGTGSTIYNENDNRQITVNQNITARGNGNTMGRAELLRLGTIL